ncbi:MAG: putative sugar nucleotidyl transferase, partial [Bacteroidota bacterium]
MNFILFNNPEWATELLPFTFTRPIAAIRCGIFTLAEKWENYLGHKVSHQADLKFRALYPLVEQDTNVIVDGNIIATPGLASVLLVLQPGEALVSGNLVIAVCHTGSLRHPDLNSYAKNSRPVEYEGGKVERLRHTCDIFAMVGNQIRADFRWIKDNFRNGKISDPYTVVYNPDNVFIEEGAKLTAAVLNATEGPIYIGKNAEVQEGAVIRGPFALGEGSVVNMGAKIRQDTAIGPYCKVGGEISNSVLMGYSNKGHDGFLGNSVLGEWCNLGADTNTSNLKNNYDNVKLWSYSERGFINTGRIFCGLMMGDHSKAGINT